ncbi:MAG: HD domain-containing phosphohydrolase [Tepidisphaeraceae bacterium]
MLIVPLEDARPGMKLAAPVYHPERPDQELLRAQFVLDEPIIRRMRAIGIEVVFVDYPSLESLDKHLAPYLSPARQKVLKNIRLAMAATQQATRPAISYQEYCTNTQDLIDTLLTQGQNPIYLDQMSRHGQDAVQHAAAVAHLSLLLGLKLEQYLVDQRNRLPSHRAKDCVNLGVAGMLHDIGMTRLPTECQRYSEADPPRDPGLRAQWETHCELAHDMLKNDLPPTAVGAVFQHHQHFDGSGFPPLRIGNLDGGQIHVFARILLAANLYDRLARPASGGPRRSNLEIFQSLRTRYNSWVDPVVLTVLEQLAPVFPPGQRVRLTDGSSAIVIEGNPHAPVRPIVQRLGPDNWTAAGPRLDLSQPGMPGIDAPGVESLAA